MKISKTIKNFFLSKEDIKKINDEKQKILVSFIWWIWFLSVSVLWLNIIHNPVVEDKILWNNEKIVSQELENFSELHWSAKNFSDKKNFFSWKKVFLSKNFYLINAVEKISEVYQENWKISFDNYQEKELFLRNVAKKYTLKNILDFRKNSTAEKNVEKFSWRLLNKTVPVGFEVDMGELEEVFVKEIK